MRWVYAVERGRVFGERGGGWPFKTFRHLGWRSEASFGGFACVHEFCFRADFSIDDGVLFVPFSGSDAFLAGETQHKKAVLCWPSLIGSPTLAKEIGMPHFLNLVFEDEITKRIEVCIQGLGAWVPRGDETPSVFLFGLKETIQFHVGLVDAKRKSSHGGLRLKDGGSVRVPERLFSLVVFEIIFGFGHFLVLCLNLLAPGRVHFSSVGGEGEEGGEDGA